MWDFAQHNWYYQKLWKESALKTQFYINQASHLNVIKKYWERVLTSRREIKSISYYIYLVWIKSFFWTGMVSCSRFILGHKFQWSQVYLWSHNNKLCISAFRQIFCIFNICRPIKSHSFAVRLKVLTQISRSYGKTHTSHSKLTY